MAEYEVFISFKNNDKFGNRTKDADMAEKLYYALEKKNIRAFYSNISIQKTAVSKFAREIDKALEQCSILVAVGTSTEHLESAWVYDEIDTFRNEMLNGNKPEGRSAIISYVSEDLPQNKLPMVLRKCQSFYDMDLLVEFIVNHRNSKGGLSQSKGSEKAIPVKANLNADDMVMGRYKILRKVGQGGMSVVYAAFDEQLQKTVAVKIVSLDNIVLPEEIQQTLMLEADLMKRLNHPSIPKIHAIEVSANAFAVVMDFIDGKTLNNYISEGNRPDEQTLRSITRQLGEVLHYLHTLSPPIIYRDMKPENVVIKSDGSITLLDFGIAREYKEELLADTACLGTVGYAAPEQYGGMGQTDPRTDIYGLGMTLYFLVSGKKPAYRENCVPIKELNPSLSDGLTYIIEKCIQRDPYDRFQSAEELLHTLKRIDKIKNGSFLSKLGIKKNKKNIAKKDKSTDTNKNTAAHPNLPDIEFTIPTESAPMAVPPSESLSETVILSNLEDSDLTVVLTKDVLYAAANVKPDWATENKAEAHIHILGFIDKENTPELLHLCITDSTPASVIERIIKENSNERVIFRAGPVKVKTGDIIGIGYGVAAMQDRYKPLYMWTGVPSEDTVSILESTEERTVTILHNGNIIENTNALKFYTVSEALQETEGVVLKLKGIRNILIDRVFGHDKAIGEIISGYLNALLKSKADKGSSRPFAIYLLAGPEGAGKVFTAESLSGLMKRPLKAIEAEGYILSQQAPERVRAEIMSFINENPKCILLFDSLEKADSDTLSLVLHLTDGQYNEGQLKNVILIVTVNTADISEDSDKATVIKALYKSGLPEALISRFRQENVIPFGAIPASGLRDIIKKKLLHLSAELGNELGIKIAFDESVFSALLLSEAVASDAGTLSSKAEAFFFKEISALFLNMGNGQLLSSISDIRKIHFCAEASELSDEKILQKSLDELKSKGKNLCFTVEREYIEEENTAQLILTDFS